MELVTTRSDPNIAGLVLVSYLKLKNFDAKFSWGSENFIRVANKTYPCSHVSETCRSIANLAGQNDLYGKSADERTKVDVWLDLSLELNQNLRNSMRVLRILDDEVKAANFLVGNRFTIADAALFAALHGNDFWNSLLVENTPPKSLFGWFKFIKQQKAILDYTIIATDEVVVRFPPEASGYLHIGHAKAALINQFYQKTYNGKLIMRFDDTNPAKENSEFEKVILEDVKMLEIYPDRFTFTSDYFDLMLEYCEHMIRNGDAYCDDTSAEAIKEQREAKIESANRNNSVEANLAKWQEMKRGSAEGLRWCVRAKIDMNALNGCMRDPTIYRCKKESHPRTGDKFAVYPTYDFACPIVDSIEGVTHTLRTMEYHDRDEQFEWFINKLRLRNVNIVEFSRLCMTNTVLSKRKLTWFVDNKLVDGWDDPRLPTVRGILRRGLTVEALRQFIELQGSSRTVVLMEWDKIWAINKKIIDPVAPRFTALERDTVPVLIRQAPCECVEVAKHPKNASIGTKKIWTGEKVLVERADADLLKLGENMTLINWGNVLVKQINREGDRVVSVEAELNLDDKDYKKTPKLTWLCETDRAPLAACVCVYFDHIISKPSLAKTDNFEDFVGHRTRWQKEMIGDPELKMLKKGDILQIQRKGFFIVDEIGAESIVLFSIPDGSMTKDSTPQAPVAKSAAKKKPEVASGKSAKPNASLAESKTKGGEVAVETVCTSENQTLVEELEKQISEQGNKVRQLKSETEIEVKKLLELKAKLKSVSPGAACDQNVGKSSSGGGGQKKDKAEKKEGADKEKKAEKENKESDKGKDKGKEKEKKADVAKKEKVVAKPKAKSVEETAKSGETKLGIQVKKSEDLSMWYSEVLTKSKMLSYSDISGCYAMHKASMFVWIKIQNWFKNELRKIDVDEESFPMLVRKSAIEREKTHLEDFSPELVWIKTKGETANVADEDPIAIRPTSETIIYPYWSEMLKSDPKILPLKVNQWCNVLRWEIKQTTPFIRNREFLWQEGHTAHRHKQDAVDEVSHILDLYAAIYTDLLAVPVIKGRKTEREKFAGAEFTYTLEVVIPANGRAVQAATSHHLGQVFSKIFNLQVQNPATQDHEYVYQNSWGLTTRSIGVMILMHSDDKGLVLPPRVAHKQVVIIACGINKNLSNDDLDKLNAECVRLQNELLSRDIRAIVDLSKDKTVGQKFNQYELNGVPIRIEIGPKDLKNNKVVAVRRDNATKTEIERSNAAAAIAQMLDAVHESLLQAATVQLNEHRKLADDWDSFQTFLDQKNIVYVPFCGSPDCEASIKKNSERDSGDNAAQVKGEASMGAKSLCIPFEQPGRALAADAKCIRPSCANKPASYVLFGRSY